MKTGNHPGWYSTLACVGPLVNITLLILVVLSNWSHLVVILSVLKRFLCFVHIRCLLTVPSKKVL